MRLPLHLQLQVASKPANFLLFVRHLMYIVICTVACQCHFDCFCMCAILFMAFLSVDKLAIITIPLLHFFSSEFISSYEVFSSQISTVFFNVES